MRRFLTRKVWTIAGGSGLTPVKPARKKRMQERFDVNPKRDDTVMSARRDRMGWTPQAMPEAAASAVHRWIVHPPLFAAGMVLLWALVAWGFNTAQYGDHFEQFGWAQSLEWGYHKHPPLPTWLLGMAVRVFGQHPW